MEKSKLLKIIGGLCIGLGVGLCFGIAMDNIWLGLLMGLGVGLCFSSAFSSINNDKK